MSTNLEIAGALKRTQKGDADWYYGGNNEAWPDLATAKLNIPASIRPGKTIGVFTSGAIVEYWWPTSAVADSDCVLKVANPTDPHFHSVTVGDNYNGGDLFVYGMFGMNGLDINGARDIYSARVFYGNIIQAVNATFSNVTAAIKYRIQTTAATFLSLVAATSTTNRTQTYQDKDGVIALLSDITTEADARVAHANSTSNPHATTLEQARTAGNAFTGDVNMATHRLLNIPDATSPNEPISKQQFDTYNNSVGGNRAGIDCTANPNYPAAVKGDRFEVLQPGKIGGAAGVPVDQYDEIVCATASAAGDHTTVGSNFYIVQGNVQRATQSSSGYVQLATSAEAVAGTDANKPLTPLTTLALVADQRKNYTKSISLSRGTPYLNEAVIYFPAAGSITSIVGTQLTNILIKTTVGGTYAAASLPMSITSASTLFIQFDYSSSTFLNGNITITGRDN